MVENLSGRDMIFNLAIARKVNELIFELEKSGAFEKKEVETISEKAKPQEIANKVNEIIDVAEGKNVLKTEEKVMNYE